MSEWRGKHGNSDGGLVLDHETWRHWRAVYEVSDLGRVRNQRTGTVLKDRINPKSQHRYHNLWLDGRVQSKYVHTIVLEAFVGQRSPGQEARHLNDRKDDNSLANLRWGTRAENVADAISNRRIKRGRDVAGAKLTEREVLEIREAHGTNSAIAATYGVTREAVSRIKQRRNWAWL